MRQQIINTTALSVVARICGFFVPLVIAAVYGSTAETDVFFLMYSGVICAMLVMGHLFEAVIVPHLVREASTDNDVDALIGVILARSTLFLCGLAGLATLCTPTLLKLTTAWPPESVLLGQRLVMIMAPALVAMAWTSTLNGALNADKAFAVSALSPLFRSAVLLASVIGLHDSLGIYAIAYGFLSGECLRLIFSTVAFHRHGHRFRLGLLSTTASTGFFRSAAFQTVGFGLLSLIPIANQLAAAWLDAGDISILSYAVQLRNVPSVLLTFGLGTVILSYWSERHNRREEEFAWQQLKGEFTSFVRWSVVAAVSLALLSQLIVGSVLGWGAFPSDKLPVVSQLFAILVLSLPFDVATLMCVRILIILRADAVYLWLAAGKLSLVIALNALVVPQFGLLGIGGVMFVTGLLHCSALLYWIVLHQDFHAREVSDSQLAEFASNTNCVGR